MSYQLHYSVTYICNSCNGTYITGYVDAGLKRTKVIEGELFPLKGSVHQLGGSTDKDTATEEEHRECLRGEDQA